MKNLVTVLIAVLFANPTNPVKANECRPCTTSPQGLSLIQFFEGFSPFIYKDSAGLDTIGYGHLIVAGEQIEQPLLGEAANALLRKDLARTEKGVNEALINPLAQNRFDALASFTFNVGVGGFVKSSALREVNAGRHENVPPQLKRWVNVNGKPVRGLILRRAAEADLYINGHQ